MKNNVLTTAIAILLFFSGSKAQTPTRWRGVDSKGIYPDKGLLKEWHDNIPEIIWHTGDFGEGFSSPVFSGGKIYLSGMLDSTGYIFILSEEGKLINKYKYGQEFYASFPGTRSSPTIVDDLIYMLSGIGKLVCLNEKSGIVKWQKDLFSDFDGKNIRWGITETLWIDGNKIYCAPGGSKNNVIALDRMTGELIWTCPGLGEVSAYCSPLVVQHGGKKILITMMSSHILGIDTENGELLWSHEHPNKWSVHANTPIYHHGAVYCFSGYGYGGVKLILNEDGSEITKAWFNSSMDNRIGGAVLIDGFIYGSGDQNRKWFCIDWENGEVQNSITGLSPGVTIAADGMLYCYTDRGEIALIKADHVDFKIVSKTKVSLGTNQHWAHPVIKNGILYLRHGNELIAYKVK